MEHICFEQRKLLDGKELVQCRIQEPNLVLPVRGQKETTRSGTEDERNSLEKLYSDLKFFISLERVDRQCNRSQGKWDAELNAIEVTRQEGNWNIFGYVKDQVQYLKPYEGLYLMEINRLEVYYNSVIVSIEQGYQLFLNIPESLALEQYIVYAKLMRNGYILFRTIDCETNSQTGDTKSDYIWAYLNELLTNTRNSKLSNNKEYAEVKNSMNAVIESTKNAVFKEESDMEVVEWHQVTQQKKKRKLETDLYPTNKRIKTDLIEECPPEFKNIFKEIDFIKLAKSNYELEECNIEFTFNLYLPNRKHFKKSSLNRPDYRIIVWNNDKMELPSKIQLEAIYFKQTYRVPIIVVFVSKFFNFNAYFYYFS